MSVSSTQPGRFLTEIPVFKCRYKCQDEYLCQVLLFASSWFHVTNPIFQLLLRNAVKVCLLMGNSWVKGLVKCFLVLEQMRNALILSKHHIKCAWHYGNWRIWLGKIKEAGLGISLGRLLSQCKLLSHQLMAGY